jgi:hypothetical protein
VSDPSVELQLCLAMEQQANAALRARLAEAERQLYALVGNTQDLAKAKHDAAVFLGLPSIYGLADSADAYVGKPQPLGDVLQRVNDIYEAAGSAAADQPSTVSEVTK